MDTRPGTNLYAGSASTVAYQELKTWLMLGEAPLGVRLREERIAERIGVSRTPVREALLRLHTERLLERHPEGGYRVSAPSTDAIRGLYDVRRALELFGLRIGFERGHDLDALRVLRDEWLVVDVGGPAGRRLDPEFVLLDEDFHARLAAAAGNTQLTEELRRINERIRPVRSHDFLTEGRIATTVEQHVGILDAVLASDAAGAADQLDRHILESQQVCEAAVALTLERMLSIGATDPRW